MKNKLNIFTYLVTIIGAIFLLLVFILSDFNCIKNSYEDMSETLDYLKYQCIRYDEIANDEEAKSLIRIADKTLYFKQDVFSNYLNKSSADDYTKEFLIEQRLTGIIITNNDSNLFFESSLVDDDKNTIDWKKIIGSKDDISKNNNKCYLERIYGEKYCYDYAIISRHDNKGVILCYLRQEVKVVLGSILSLSTLLDRVNIDNNGLIFFTTSDYVVSSNLNKYNDVKIKDCEFVSKVLNEKSSQNEFVKISVNKQNYYSLNARVKNYFIYVFYPSSKVFVSRQLIISYSIVIYIAIISLLVLFKA